MKAHQSGPVVQLVRTLACHARGQGFESPSDRQNALVAQLVEQGTENPRVGGSSPPQGTSTDLRHAGVAQLAEQLICNQQVVGSIPITSSKCMGGFPSGQREQTVNLLSPTSVVRIHLLPPKSTHLMERRFYFTTTVLRRVL